VSDAINAKTTIVQLAMRRKWSDEETRNLLEAWPLENTKPDLKTCSIIKENTILKDPQKIF